MLGFTGDTVVSEIKGVKVERFNAAYAAILALSQNKIDAVVLDSEPAKKYTANNKQFVIANIPAEEEDYAIAFNAVPIDGEDIHLYDMLEVLRAEYVGAIIPYDEDILTYTQDGRLLEFVSSELKAMLAPLVDYVTTGECWEDYDVQKHFDAYVTKKKTSKEQDSTPSLATVGESIFEDSNNVHYINRGGWTTQRLLVQGKQSLWRRSKLK